MIRSGYKPRVYKQKCAKYSFSQELLLDIIINFNLLKIFFFFLNKVRFIDLSKFEI